MTDAAPDTDALLARTDAFVRDRVAPGAAQRARTRGTDREAIVAAAAAGLTAIETPREHGGLGLPFGAKVAVARRIAAADFGVAFSVVNTQNVAARLARHAATDVAARWVPGLLAGRWVGCSALTEPHAGSDFAAIGTLARPVPGGWRIDGAKAWITHGADADLAIAYVQTDPEARGRGVAGFVIDLHRAGVSRGEVYAIDGPQAIGAGGFELRDYLAGDDELLFAPGIGFKAALASVNGARTYVAAMCCGMVGEALRVARAYGARRHTFGAPLAAHQGWRWRIAEAATELAACDALVEIAVRAVEAGADAVRPAAQAKLAATRMAERQLPRLAQAMGAEGLRESYPFGRHLLAARVASFVDGSTEMLLERIAAALPPPDGISP
jgi:alkylation response protein AidB-like acyl-CoA dehydrogenase